MDLVKHFDEADVLFFDIIYALGHVDELAFLCQSIPFPIEKAVLNFIVLEVQGLVFFINFNRVR